jgi:uracil-DNA glycosylase family 4
MDRDTFRQVEDWIKFFQELGFEEFYLRPQGATAESLAPKASAIPLSASPNVAFGPTFGNKPLAASEASAGSAKPASSAEPPITAAPQFTVSRPVAPQSLSLFEAPPVPSAPAKHETLEEIQADLGDCHRCKLSKGRKHIVFGQGNPRAELVFVGEGPGADEDDQGLPFVGRAGQLLNRMLQLIQIRREDVYICNVVKCRPPGNRTPEPDEIATCSPFLFRQIQSIQPRLVCCLGSPAARTVLGIKEGITKIHGQFFDYGTGKALATVHPAYVLRNPREEVILRDDFEKIRQFLKSA